MNNAWNEFFLEEEKQPYFSDLKNYLHNEYATKHIYPPQKDVFKAFRLTDPRTIKVVIIGQDPYHTPGVANGLAFSTNPHNPIPPSLRNIFIEMQREYGGQIPTSGDLTYLANQGVFLLNNVLTVQEGLADSHHNIGWETFTDHAISYLQSFQHPHVYLLWGRKAQSKIPLIQSNNFILTSVHPSPLSASRGFFGNNHFKLCNDFLSKHNQTPIVWLP